jgi:hypothetical protein
MMLSKSRVEFSVQGNDWGRRYGPGAMVDLDEVVGKDAGGAKLRLRDVVREDWFEPVDDGHEEQ